MSAVLATLPTAAVKPLEACVIEWMQAKAQEDAANARRLAIEARILELATPPEEGSTTVKLDSGFKLTLTGKLAYKCADPKALAEACASSGMPGSWAPVKTTLLLDATGAKWLRQNEPELWRSVVAKHVTVEPAKTAVKVAV